MTNFVKESRYKFYYGRGGIAQPDSTSVNLSLPRPCLLKLLQFARKSVLSGGAK